MDFYRSPSFQFYHGDFLAGVSSLSGEEVGPYWLLCIECWNKGGVNGNDIASLARIGKISPARMKRLWPLIRSKFVPSPWDEHLVTNPKIEKIRSEASTFARSRQVNGRLGGRPKSKPTQNLEVTYEEPTGNLDESKTEPTETSSNFRLLSSDIAAVATSQDSNPRAREETPSGRAAESPALGFGRWFLARGVALGLIGEHHNLDPLAWALKERGASEKLITAYGDDACRQRAERLFQARLNGKMRGAVSVTRLAAAWDFDELKAATPTGETAAQKFRREVRGEKAS